MESGNGEMMTLLSSREIEEIEKTAIEKEKAKPYQKGESPWLLDEQTDPMSDEETLEINREINKRLGQIFEKLEVQETDQMRETTLVARESVIETGDVKIMPLIGQWTTLPEYLGDQIERKVWEFEPHPDFEESARFRARLDISGFDELGETKEQKVWLVMEETLARVNEEKKISLDIKNLTPFQAVELTNRVLISHYNFDNIFLRAEAHKLRGYLNDNIAAYNPKLIERIGKKWYLESAKFKSHDRSILELARECLRANLEMEYAPPEDTWATLYKMAEADKKAVGE